MRSVDRLLMGLLSGVTARRGDDQYLYIPQSWWGWVYQSLKIRGVYLTTFPFPLGLFSPMLVCMHFLSSLKSKSQLEWHYES